VTTQLQLINIIIKIARNPPVMSVYMYWSDNAPMVKGCSCVTYILNKIYVWCILHNTASVCSILVYSQH